MTHLTPEALYALLPAIYRIRDAEQAADGQDGPLRALVEVLGQQGQILEEDIARLYDNAFIETCDEWVVPYLGDLLGVRTLHSVGVGAGFSQRARVANTLAYRRRKGTATMLEQLARDTTGWPARAVEFFDLVATTQHVNHPRLHNVRAPDLRDPDALERLDTAFDTIAHTADVRHIASGRGRHNLPHVGLFLWRLQAYVLPRVQARAATAPADGRYRVHPYGLDVPLFTIPQTETEITHLAEERNVPGRLRRRPLYDELEARRAALLGDAPHTPVAFGDLPVIRVVLDGAELLPEQILICNLGAWDAPGWAPPASVSLEPGLDTLVAVDPVLGRLALLTGTPAVTTVETTVATGFPGDVGGGPYDRHESLGEGIARTPTWTASVGAGGTFSTLTDAITDGAGGWNAQPPGAAGVLTILDNATYAETLAGPQRILIPEGSRLVIASASLSADGDPVPLERRTHLLGDVEVEGTAPLDSPTPGALVLDGLLIEGEVRVVGDGAEHSLGRLRLAHVTVGLHDPDSPVGVVVGGDPAANPELVVELDHAVCGPVSAPETIRAVELRDSVVQGGADALAGEGGAPGPPATIERCTLFGAVHVREVTLGSESLFTDGLRADRLQTGCVRFCYVPPRSRTPRRYRCQPELALRQRAEALGLPSAAALPPAERARIVRRLRPSFTAVRYGDPAYAQLAVAVADEVRTGAEDGSEMGVWSVLRQPQRVANLESSLPESLRFGLEAGLLFAT